MQRSHQHTVQCAHHAIFTPENNAKFTPTQHATLTPAYYATFTPAYCAMCTPCNVHTSILCSVHTMQCSHPHAMQCAHHAMFTPTCYAMCTPAYCAVCTPCSFHTSGPCNIHTSTPSSEHISTLQYAHSTPCNINTSTPCNVHTSTPCNMHTRGSETKQFGNLMFQIFVVNKFLCFFVSFLFVSFSKGYGWSTLKHFIRSVFWELFGSVLCSLLLFACGFVLRNENLSVCFHIDILFSCLTWLCASLGLLRTSRDVLPDASRQNLHTSGCQWQDHVG